MLAMLSLSSSLRDLRAFPTRRSSDLAGVVRDAARSAGDGRGAARRAASLADPARESLAGRDRVASGARRRGEAGCRSAARVRSEEHTSELQSPCNLVCRLLLQKKIVE